MPTTVDCPSCSRKLRIPDELLGKKVKCPTCGNTFTASGGAAPPVEEEEAPSPPPRAAARRPVAPRPEEEEEYEDRPARGRRGGGSRLAPHRGVLILILGILSIVIGYVGVVMGPIAWSMGGHDLKEIAAGRMDPEGQGLTNGGRICGIIGTILGVLEVLCCIVYIAGVAIFTISQGNMK
jgi:predicted Zn finger-like uncharacterized protein